MIKKIVVLVLFAITFQIANAQEQGSFIYINGGGGFHNLQYKPTNGTVKGGIGFTGNIGYDYFFTPNWGIGLGVGMQSLQSEATIHGITEFSAIDYQGDSYEYRTYYTNWKEKQTAMLLDIPLEFLYKRKLTEKWEIQSSLGGKISIPLHASYETTGGSIETRGYYEQYNIELYNVPEYGFETYNSFPSKSIALKPVISSFIDLGGRYKIRENLDLYTGLYCNYGITNMSKKELEPLFDLGNYNGVLSSNNTNKVTYAAFGLKIGLTLHLQSKKNQKPVVAVIETESEIVPIPDLVIPDIKDTAIAITEPQSVVIEQAVAKNEKMKIEAKKIASGIDIKFVLNSMSALDNSQDVKVKELADLLIANPEMNLKIIGHTCNSGSHSLNLRIGMERATVIKNKFIELGVPATQLTTISKAYDEPLVPNTSEENKAINRRGQLIIQ